MTHKVMYCHGRGSNGTGTKSLFLQSLDGIEVVANDYPTNDPLLQFGEFPDGFGLRDMAEYWRYVQMLTGDIKIHQPDVIVASSFGGAVLLRVMLEGGWTGPAVFLAQAGVKFTVSDRLPTDARAILIHGEFDEVVHISGSVQLADSSPNATLVRVADGHRLHRDESKQALKDAVLQLISEL